MGLALEPDGAPLLELEPADGAAPAEPSAGGLRRRCVLGAPELSLLEPALAPGLVDSREAPPAEAPDTSGLELRAELPGADVLDESLGAPAAELLLGPAPPADGAFWAKAAVAAAARAATAQSVVMVRIWESSLRAPAALTTRGGAFGSAKLDQLRRATKLGRR